MIRDGLGSSGDCFWSSLVPQSFSLFGSWARSSSVLPLHVHKVVSHGLRTTFSDDVTNSYSIPFAESAET